MFNFCLYFQILTMFILTLNCNGIRDQSKRNGLLQWLRSLPASVCLQETHCVSVNECSEWFHSTHSCGCVILFRPSLLLVNSWCDFDGRFFNLNFYIFPNYFVFVVFIV